jgi:hypothetical protein
MPELTRRTALLTASAAGFVPAAERRRGVTTFVFAAGTNGISATPNELILHGHRGVGPGRHHGRRSGAATVDVVRRAAAHGPVVLVGASIARGGAACRGCTCGTCGTGSSRSLCRTG